MSKVIYKDILASLFFGLWLMDTASTVSFVHQFGVEAEANPIMRWVMIHWGMMTFVCLKAAIIPMWMLLYRHANILIHAGLVVIMSPVVYMGMRMAWGF